MALTAPASGGSRHPLAPQPHPAPPRPAEPHRRLPPDPGVTHDSQGKTLPSVDDISGLCADLVEWGPCSADPWHMWGWSSVIFHVHYYAPEFIGTTERDWRILVRASDAHTAASTLIYMQWSLDYPAPLLRVVDLFHDICWAFSSPSRDSDPHVRAIHTIRNTIDRKIVESLPEGGPVFLSPLKLPALRDIRAIWPKRLDDDPHSYIPSPGIYANCDHADWLIVVNLGERIARERLLLSPETLARAETAIGPQLVAIAALAVFAERTPTPAAERFPELVRWEASQPGYLKDGLRSRPLNLLRPGPGHKRTQS